MFMTWQLLTYCNPGYAAVTFPGVSEGVQYGNFSIAEVWVSKTARGIVRAAEILAI